MTYDLVALVVDDSKTALMDIKAKLSAIIPSENLFLAKSFYEAETLINNHDFDLAFVDLQMPDKTGMDLIIDVINTNPKTKDLPIVITTGMGSDSLVVFTLKELAFKYLYKPISQEEVEEVVKEIAARKS